MSHSRGPQRLVGEAGARHQGTLTPGLALPIMVVQPWARPQPYGDLGRPLSRTRHFAEVAFMNCLRASHFIVTNMRWEPAGYPALCEFGVRSGRA